MVVISDGGMQERIGLVVGIEILEMFEYRWQISI